MDSSLAAAEYSKAKLNWLDVYNRFSQSKVQLSLLTALDTAAIGPDLGNETLLFSTMDSSTSGMTNTGNHPFLTYFHSIYENGQAREQLIRKSYFPKFISSERAG